MRDHQDPHSRANRRAWKGRPGHYEVWYVTFNDGDRGYWIRTTLRAPRQGPPEGALWFVEFVPGRRPRAWKETIAPPEGIRLQGRAGEAEWDLEVASEGTVFRPIPAGVRALVPTKIVTPHLDARIRGAIRVGSEMRRIENARGTQSHLWGKGYGGGWAWAHANFDGAVFEGLTGRKPAVAAFFARSRRLTWRMNTSLALFRNRSTVRPSPAGWSFSSTTHNRELVGKITCNPEHIAGVTYVGPSGEKRYCYNTEIAEMELTLRTRATFGTPWTTAATLRGPAHYEVCYPEPQPGIELLIT